MGATLRVWSASNAISLVLTRQFWVALVFKLFLARIMIQIRLIHLISSSSWMCVSYIKTRISSSSLRTTSNSRRCSLLRCLINRRRFSKERSSFTCWILMLFSAKSSLMRRTKKYTRQYGVFKRKYLSLRDTLTPIVMSTSSYQKCVHSARNPPLTQKTPMPSFTHMFQSLMHNYPRKSMYITKNFVIGLLRWTQFSLPTQFSQREKRASENALWTLFKNSPPKEYVFS